MDDLEKLVKSEKEVPNPFPDCGIFHDKFSHCLKPTVQVSHIYKHSTAQNCGEFVHDWRKCMSAKLTKDPKEIQSLYEETHYHKLSLETGNDVFQYKDKPSW